MISDADLQSELSNDIQLKRSPYQQDSFLVSYKSVLMSFQKPCCLIQSIQFKIVHTSRFTLKQERLLE